MIQIRSASIVAIVGCTLACSAPESGDGSGDGKADLPNFDHFDREQDISPYQVIAGFFAERGLDMTPRPERLTAAWPINEGKTAVLNRFGTPILLGELGYFHTALDVFRSSTQVSDVVVAPVTGTAAVFDWDGMPVKPMADYMTVVAIWDPESHLVFQLMHVKPDAYLLAGDTVEVTRGEKIGVLAADMVAILSTEKGDRLRHAHVSVVDGAAMRALDPAELVPYVDTVAPAAVAFYALDGQAKRQDKLVSGKLDLVLEVFDRDDDSDRNFEVARVAYELRDQSGQVLQSLPACRLADVFGRIGHAETARAVQLLDFGNAAHQQGRGDWPESDIDDRQRTFRYALTQLAVADGVCDVVSDADGFVDIADDVTSIELSATLWDSRGNMTAVTKTLAR